MKGKLKKIDKNKLPVYQITLDDSDETGIALISLVDSPAIEIKGMCFNENKLLQFKEIKDKQRIIGPALIPDMKILRDDDGTGIGPHYVVFTKDTIERMVEKFNAFGSNRKINIDHTNKMVDGFIMENWIVKDSTFDKSRFYGFDVPVGTYMIDVKIDDKNFWDNQVKGEGLYGFSIQGFMGQQLISMNKEEIKESDIDGLDLDDLLNIFDLN